MSQGASYRDHVIFLGEHRPMSRHVSGLKPLHLVLPDCMVSRLASFWQVFWGREVVAGIMRQSKPGKAGGFTSCQVCGLSSLSFEHGLGMVCGTTESRLARSKFWWRRVGQ